MAEAKTQETLSVDADKFFKAVTSYESYPKFVTGCKSAKVERSGSGAKVAYEVSMMKDISYALEHSENAAAGTMTWQLVSSDFIKKNSGAWKIESAGPGKCKIEYKVEIEFKIPVPGFVLSGLIKSNLPSMVREFEKFAKTLA